MVIVDEVEVGKGRLYFLSTENMSCNHDLLEINMLVQKFLDIYGTKSLQQKQNIFYIVHINHAIFV